MNDDRDLRSYAYGLLAEEAGELTTEIGRGLRFGFDSPVIPHTRDQQSEPQTEAIAKEAADVIAAIEWCIRAGVLDRAAVTAMATMKIRKLIDPGNLDYLGRPLAPIIENPL